MIILYGLFSICVCFAVLGMFIYGCLGRNDDALCGSMVMAMFAIVFVSLWLLVYLGTNGI